MLQISSTAAEAIDAITRSVPGSAGVRISTLPQASTNGSGPVAVFDFYPTPEPGEADAVRVDRVRDVAHHRLDLHPVGLGEQRDQLLALGAAIGAEDSL